MFAEASSRITNSLVFQTQPKFTHSSFEPLYDHTAPCIVSTVLNINNTIPAAPCVRHAPTLKAAAHIGRSLLRSI
eukprot:6190507-Pleurochrysis_carterae.AAC.2